ncbi:DNA integrity scanning protein DisA nucleotide-binding domain protein [Priestia filamentosa]|uniref:sporulation-specific diadenylate cyclase CdaS n=1 Tax=Priestia filamentosa TaxID=1402861 RepID=UPI001FB439C9|nr:sporulation-specific diadenylate cyclase CdaS [Priestia filamentosa]MED3727623.1 sporulation-specific diadenylate cyclase CdaS [Priestia filamentosa]UOE62824.1 DNA integrity scanning protein DisA nucleotide-binding domain protein [Priestia filamentosa]
MDTPNCDFSPMKQQLAEGIQQITNELQHSLGVLDNESYCLLGKLEGIKEKFINIESVAASFYLNCYLAAFTDKYAELSLCVQRLSDRRHGALIVVERRDTLDSFIQKGTDVGATLTPALLEAIFYPGNPLHDGAVLIRSNQIVSAANVLPLTATVISGKKLGTRHRAALGLTEQSDALVLVVSEETGRVSFALNGKLYPIITTASL